MFSPITLAKNTHLCLPSEPRSPESPAWADYLEEDDEGMPEGNDQREYISDIVL